MRNRCAGYSLLELLVAMTIYAIVTLAIASQMVYATAAASLNAQASQAIIFAQEYLEDLRRQTYASLTSGSGTETWNGVTFTVAWTVTTNVPVSGTKTIVMTVSWSHKGTTQTYATRTVYSQIPG